MSHLFDAPNENRPYTSGRKIGLISLVHYPNVATMSTKRGVIMLLPLQREYLKRVTLSYSHIEPMLLQCYRPCAFMQEICTLHFFVHHILTPDRCIGLYILNTASFCTKKLSYVYCPSFSYLISCHY